MLLGYSIEECGMRQVQRMLCVALLGLADLSSEALAGDAAWKFVAEGRTPTGVKHLVFFDQNSVKIGAAGLVQVWTLDSSKALISLPLKKKAGKRYRSLLALEFFDCTEKKSGMQQAVYHQGEMGVGAVVSSWDEPGTPELRAYPPESMGEEIIEKVCAAASTQPLGAGAR